VEEAVARYQDALDEDEDHEGSVKVHVDEHEMGKGHEESCYEVYVEEE
jgi:hypothetical protein